MSSTRPYKDLDSERKVSPRSKIDRSKSAGDADHRIAAIGERPRSQSSSSLVRRTLSKSKAEFFDDDEVNRVRNIAKGQLVEDKKSSEMSLRKRLSRKTINRDSLEEYKKREEKRPLLDDHENSVSISPLTPKL